jgi:prepilin-type N-terminal cleavage/methylation domain-containing protein
MKPSLSAFRRAAGFTLIEILIVLALMGVLMAIGLPNLFAYIQHQKILGITQQTAMVFRLARLESIKTANNAVVKLDTAAATVTGYMDLNQNLTQDAAEPALWRLDLPKGITGSVDRFTTPPTPAVLVFRSDGSAAAPGGFIFLNNKGDQLEASVPGPSNLPLQPVNTGRVEIRKLQGSAWKLQGEGGQSWTWQ